MCGISGIYNLTDNRQNFPDDKDVFGMIAAMKHRGPDNDGIYVSRPIALGASRLAIIDPSPAGSQPMVIGNGDYVIVFNGEIYNYLELREELEKDGIPFTGKSDTEVLLRIFVKKGVACLADLRGMFAFAIWNKSDQTLFLARDRIGEKPLVYYHHNGIFAFASEIKALLTLPQIRREVDPIGLHYGFYHVSIPAPYSAFKHIRKLRPASYMIISKNGVKTERYWQGRYSRDDLITDQHDCVQEIIRCLDETVRIMCRSDVPLGATLSGGLDSSGIVTAMSRELVSFDTFCISHKEGAGDDSEFEAARRVARRYGTKHHETKFTKNHISTLPEVVQCYGEPIFSFVPLHAQVLSSSIKENVTVALTGSGGDELFGGYDDHRFLQKYDQRFRVWDLLDGLGIGWLARMCPFSGIRRSQEKYSALRKIPLSRLVPEMRFGGTHRFCEEAYSDKMKEIVRDCDPAALYVQAFDEYNAPNLLDGFMYQQLMVGSQHSIVDIPDISGMACSLEYRSPFLDVEMVELAMKIPWHLKVKRKLGDSGGKWILRQAMRDRLPKEIVSMKKAGFGSDIPYHTWILQDWSGFIEKKLRSPALIESGLFDTERLQVLYEFAKKGHHISVEWFWSVVMVAQWFEEFF